MKSGLNMRRIEWAVGQILFLFVLAAAAWLIIATGVAEGFFCIMLLCCIAFLAAADIVILFRKH